MQSKLCDNFLGALDKTVLVWKVPQQLVSQSNLMDSLRNKKKRVSNKTKLVSHKNM